MQTRFVCLANSFKEGGRCIAGIELNKNNDPIILGGRPKWIRPVHTTEHGQVPNYLAEPLQILNIVEINITGNKPEGYQSENVTFDEKSIKVIGNFNRDKLSTLCETQRLIFGNRGKAVSHDSIDSLSSSLMLVSVSEFEITQITYEDNPDKPKFRLVFQYNSNRYDLPVTDPAFLHKYQSNNSLLQGKSQLILTLSLGVALNNWYYKLVAGIVY